MTTSAQPAHQASLTLDPRFTVAPVRRRTFGAFVEHLGRCVYTGIFEPEHPTADADGFRADVLELVKELGISSVRYPGGNFVSGYKWEDGVGPVDQRPVRHDLAWHSTEPNTFGLDEFMTWMRHLDAEPMMAVNLGTRGVQEALDVLEYSNAPQGTHWSDYRAANGSPDPYKIMWWCLGNEMDGPWQIGAKSADDYGKLAAATARALRMEEPGLELVVCGSSGRGMPTFGAWEAKVLEHTFDVVDMISAHSYYNNQDDDAGSFLASAVDMDRFVASVTATADYIAATKKSDKKIMVSYDEWNVWYLNREPSKPPTGDDWPVAPVLLEDRYSALDAVVFGSLLISLLRNSDRVASASLAQLVNVIAPIMTEPGGRAWKQTTFDPFALTSALARGEVLDVRVASDTYETAKYGIVNEVDAVATWDAETATLAVFAVNRSQSSAQTVRVDLRSFDADLAVTLSKTLTHEDPLAINTADDPDNVAAVDAQNYTLEDGVLTLDLPAMSWNVAQLAAK
ncbi:alpha-L-arabinofuranosidase [Micrococcales bacterium 31B]|nr:alpha-L-arabinofuranosidase [Micrococcales bacterium 31B]